MLALLQVTAPSALEQYGVMGVMCALLLTAVAYLGKRMLDIVKEVSTTNAQSAAAITQSVAVLDKLEARVGEMEHGLEKGVMASLAAHEKNGEKLDEILERKRRSGAAGVPTIFGAAVMAGAGLLGASQMHEERKAEPHAVWTHAFDLLAQAQPGVIL